MTSENNMTVQCPTCKKPVVWQPDNEFRPFCSHRCQLIDLGAWSSEEYRIPENKTQEHWSEPPEKNILNKKSLN